jgi:LmbE family N-acetylglucosaminyl deacetylase
MKGGTSRTGCTDQGFEWMGAKAETYLPNPKVSTDSVLNEKIVICSPHFDDAVLSCWSLLDRDHASTVVNVFTGAPSSDFTYCYDQQNGALSSAIHMQQRAEEDRHALDVAGKLPINLGMLERQYRLRPSPWLHKLLRFAPLLRYVLLRLPFLDSALHSIASPDVVQLADAITQAVPGATSIWVPAGIGGHTDHLLVRQAGLVLAARGLKVCIYADMPYVLRFGWPQWLKAADRDRPVDRASACWASYFDGLAKPENVIEQARVVYLTPAERLRKAEAIRRYATQFDPVKAGRVNGLLRMKDALAYEVFWELKSLNAKASKGR